MLEAFVFGVFVGGLIAWLGGVAYGVHREGERMTRALHRLRTIDISAGRVVVGGQEIDIPLATVTIDEAVEAGLIRVRRREEAMP